MYKKILLSAMLILTIGLLILGVCFKSAAKKQQGLSATTGIIVDGEFKEQSSGQIGANQEKYEMFNSGGTMFYVLSGVMGIAFIITFIINKKSK